MFYPNGNMCINCVHVDDRDCAKLPFSTMKKIKVDNEGDTQVACSAFERRKNEIN